MLSILSHAYDMQPNKDHYSGYNEASNNGYSAPSAPSDLGYTSMYRQDSLSDLFMTPFNAPPLHRSSSILEGQPVLTFSPVLGPASEPAFYPAWGNQPISQAEIRRSDVMPPHFAFLRQSHDPMQQYRSSQQSSSPMSLQHVPVTFSTMEARFTLPQQAIVNQPNTAPNVKSPSRSSTPAIDSLSEQLSKLPQDRRADQPPAVEPEIPTRSTSFKQPADRPVLRRNTDGSQSVPLMQRSLHSQESTPAAQRANSVILSPAAAAPSPPTTRSGRKRSRNGNDGATAPVIPASVLEGLNKEEVKKIKHRSIDAFRRAREAAAVARLSSWIDSFEHSGDSSSSPPTPTAREKLAVLEASGTHLESLSSRVTELEKSTARLEDENAVLKQQLHQTYEWMKHATTQAINGSNTPSIAASNVDAAAMIRSLQNQSIIYRSIFQCSRRTMMVLSLETGRCLDVNASFSSLSGLPIKDIMQGRYSWPLTELMAQHNDQSVSDYSHKSARTSGEASPSALTRRMGLQQHPANASLLMSLLKGSQDHVECVFTVVNDDATPMNVDADCWLGRPSDQGVANNGHDAATDGERADLLADITARPFSYQLAISFSW